MRRRGNERGQLLVESTLVLLSLIIIMVAILDFAQVFYLHQSLNERVRAALRYGSVRAFDADAIRNVVLYGQDTPPNGVGTAFQLSPSNVVVTRLGADTSADRIMVTVKNYSYTFFSPYIAGAKTGAPIIGVISYEGVH